MPVQSLSVRFQLSGGLGNENPHLSLGGQISTATNRNITSNVLHNLFDEVTNAEAVSGEFEYRHMYYRNGHEFTTRNTRLIVLTDSTSIWSKIEFAKGTAANGSVEQAIPSENTPPVGIPESSWRIPNGSSPLVLGDVLAGSVASIWLRRKIEPGALIARNEKVHIRIIGDPPIPAAPPIQCPAGQHFDPTTQTCVDDDEQPDPDCPEGQHKDANGNCVPNTGVPCPDGTHLEGNQCVPDGSPDPPEPVRAIITADLSCSDEANVVLANVRGLAGALTNLDLFIANGDLSYASNPDCFMELLDAYELTEKTRISIGNHDDDEDGNSSIRSAFISQFGMPSVGYFSFNIQNIHFLIMDTQSNYSLNSPQYNFARTDLQGASLNAQIDWIVVCYHKPSITIPSDHAPLNDFRDLYHPLFDQFKVDLIVAGHNHNMQQTHMIKYNPASPATPTIVSTGTTTEQVNHIYTNIDGRIFAVCGAGGRSHYDLGSRPAWFAFGNDEHYGCLALSWINNNKSLSAIFFRAVNDGETIEELHSFTIHKTTV